MTDYGLSTHDQPKVVRFRAAYFWVTGALIISLLGAGTYVLFSAIVDRNARMAQLPQMAGRLSTLLDREVETALARLVGLSTSPALLEGDLATFHRQMLRTPLPKGSVLAVSDTSRQLANAAMPFGTELPSLSAYTPQPQFLERLDAEGSYISSRVYGPVAQIHAVTVSVKAPDEVGRLKYILTTAILGERLTSLMHQAEAPLPGGAILLFDAMAQELSGPSPEDVTAPIAQGLQNATAENRGLFVPQDGKASILSGYDRSALTGWTVVVTAGQNWIDKPMALARQVLLAMTFMALVGAAVFVQILRNRVSRPYQAMANQLHHARQEVAQLGDTMLVARQQEHRRIAQELHDTTAQKLVAADLYLQSMSATAFTKDRKAPLSVVRSLLSQALEELRTFSFLLRPDQLADEGFRDYFEAFVQGFCYRADLVSRTDFPQWLDDIDEQVQSVFLRITRETLSNIYRHAGAKTVSASVVKAGGTFVLSIEDDGIGGISFPFPRGPKPSGLGISGMAEALAQCGGSLVITALPGGTRMQASVPIRVE